MTNAQTELEAQSNAIDFVHSLINNGYKSDVKSYYISVDRRFLCVVSSDLETVSINQELLDPTLELLFK